MIVYELIIFYFNVSSTQLKLQNFSVNFDSLYINIILELLLRLSILTCQ
jgi:hypothetical protein